MSDMRYDPVGGNWVLFSPERGERLDYFVTERDIPEYTIENCPFCPGNEKMTMKDLLVIKDKNKTDWALRVIPNSYPLLRVEEKPVVKIFHPYHTHSKVGAHEVIIESRKHYIPLAEYDTYTLNNLFTAVRQRILDLKNDIRLKCMYFMKNSSKVSGATLQHPHSQLLALPVIPNKIARMLENSWEYYVHNEKCIFCQIIEGEMEQKVRILCRNESFLAFAPFASCYPFKITIIPFKHLNDFTSISDVDSVNLANITKNVFRIIGSKLNNPPINLALYNTPYNVVSPKFEHAKNTEPYFHWHLDVIPRINKTGGIETGLEMFVNPITPEKCIEILRSE